MRSIGQDTGFNYNQVMGWIRVERDGPGVIKTYAYEGRQTRFTRKFKAVRANYEWVGKVSELWFQEETSQQIAVEIRRDLMELTKKGGAFPRRHLDLEAFDSLAPHLDSRSLLGLPRDQGSAIS